MIVLPAWLRVRQTNEIAALQAMPAAARRQLDCMEYEDRTLFSATPMGAELLVQAAAGSGETVAAPTAANETNQADPTPTSAPADSSQSNPTPASTNETSPSASATTAGQARDELVVVDTSISNYQQLLDDLTANADGSRKFHIVLLDPSQDGMQQITAAISQYNDLSAIHFVTHASAGEIRIGDTRLTAANFDDYSQQIALWRASLTEDADLLFYGCDLAASAEGRSLLSGIERATGADVAASTNDTGNALLGGDWQLEYTSGRIETAGAFSAAVEHDWMNLLNTTLDSVSSGVGNNLATLTIAHTTSGTNRLMLVAIAIDPHGETVTSVTYDGVSLTYVGSQQMPGDGNHSRVELWQMLAPTTGTHDVVVNLSGTANNGLIVGVATFTGVNQATPLINLASNFGTSTAASVTVASQTGDLVFGFVHSHKGTDVSPGAGQTEYWDLVDEGSNGGGTLSTGAASVSNTWTLSKNDNWTAIGVSIQADTNSVVQAALTPVQDSYLQLSNPATNTGSNTSIVIDRETIDLQRALVQFDLSSIPAGATIQSATLDLESTQIGGSITINVYQLLESWAEGSTTWSERSSGSAWSTAGGSYNSTPLSSLTTAATGTHSFDITSLVQAWLSGTQQNNGVLLGSPDGGGNRTVTYDSREGTTPPVLRLTYSLPGNTAPTLDASRPVLNGVSEDAGAPVGAVGTLVSSLVDFASPSGQVDNVVDPDASAQLGIAVTAADTSYGSWWYSLDNGANWNALGAVSNNNARLLAADANTRVYFQPNADFDGAVPNAITFRAWDQTTGTNGAFADTTANGGTSAFSLATDSADITVAGINDAPVNTVTGAQTMNEDGTLTFSSGNGNQISITDVDAGSNSVQVTLTATNGTLSLNGVTGLSFSTGTGTGDATMTFTGTVTDINTALDGLSFTPTNNFSGAAGLQIVTNDQGNTGSGGALSDTDSVAITVNAVNDAPVNTVPGAQTMNEDGTLVFSSGNSNQISIADVDAGSSSVQVTLTATNGTITLNGVTGLSFSTGDGTSDGTMTFTGTVANINTALNGLSFSSTGNFSGAASLQIVTNDQGNTGSGGAQSDNDSIAITVSAVNDAPVNTIPGAQSTNEDTALVFSSGNGNQISIADSDAGSGSVQVTLTATNGTITLNGIAGLSFSTGDGTSDGSMTFTGTVASINTALNGLSFAPTGNFSGAASLQIVTNDQGNTGSGGALSDTDFVAIAVNAVNDPPVLSIPGTQNTPFQTALTFSNANGNALIVSDVDAGSSTVRLTITPQNGTITLAQTVGLTFLVGTGAGDSLVTIEGTLANLNAALDGSTFTPDSTYRGATTVSLSINDLGNSGSGGSLVAAGQVDVVVAPSVQRILFSGPTAQAAHNFQVVFSSATGNALQFSDAYGENTILTVTITTANGTLTLATTQGLLFISGSGGASSMSFTGTVSDVNAALNGSLFSTTVSDSSLSVYGTDPPRDGTGSQSAGSITTITQPPVYPSTLPQTPVVESIEEIIETETDGSSEHGTAFLMPPGTGIEVHREAPIASRSKRPSSEVFADSSLGKTGLNANIQQQNVLQFASIDREMEQRLFASTQIKSVLKVERPGVRSQLTAADVTWSRAEITVDDGDAANLRDELIVGTAGITASLSVGYVLWSIRAASLLSTMLSSMPAWQSFDPLPVINQVVEKRVKSPDDDDDADELF